MKRFFQIILLVFLLFHGFFVNAQRPAPQLSLVPSSVSGINFRNDIQETPQMFLYMYEYLYIGAGVSVGDINNDGLPDIYFASTLGSNKLYLNEGNFHFKDITETAGVSGGAGIKNGVNMIDINNDGYIDIFVSKSGYDDPTLRKKILYINNGDGTFTDRAKEYGLDDLSFGTQGYFFDFDNDGDKDLYLLNHPKDFSKSMTIPATYVNGKLVYVDDTTNTRFVSDRLFENKGNKFIDITAKAGLINHAFGLSVSIADINKDGWQDLYVANDFNKPDYLYINNGNGTFSNKLADYIKHVSFSSMGSDIADINNDGLEDIYVMDMAVNDPVRQKQLFAVNQNYDKFQLMLKFGLYHQYPRNTLQLNNGNNSYSEVGNFAGVAETEWSWSPIIADFDNDGLKDIYITNGLKRDMTDWDYKVFVLDSVMNVMNTGKTVDLNTWLQSMPSVPVQNYVYRNKGNLQFDELSTTWTDAPPSFSNGAAYADLDNDGDLDLVVNNIDGEAFVFKNMSREKRTQGHFIKFKFFDKPGSFNETYGTIVKLIFADGQQQIQHYNPQRGFLSTSEHNVHFGTGTNKSVSSVEIIFPNQKTISLLNLQTDSNYTYYMSEAVAKAKTVEPSAGIKFTSSNLNFFKYNQVENDFIDFKREPLIPYKCSRKGPYFSRGDVNNDKLEDFYLSGAAGEAGMMMMQTSSGNFAPKTMAAFTADKKYEDMGSVLFDADGDGDPDLYVVSGGAEFTPGSELYQDRLYINDGKGNFTRNNSALPLLKFNGSVVSAFDFDADGDLDLFVGGHVVPGSFPKTEQSFLLKNDNGKFTDVTDQIAPALKFAGIINKATWSSGTDGKPKLWITGEWMSPKEFEFTNNSFSQVKNKVIITTSAAKDSMINMDDLTGWWYNMQQADVDEDGDLDIILANRGLNSSIKAAVDKPTTIYAKDFDKNGSYDAVLGYYNGEKCYPLYSRDQLIDQMPGMRKKFVRYRAYSGKTLDEIFTPEEKTGMDVYTTRFFESGILINEGNNTYRFKALPYQAQLSNINDLIYQDIDSDGIKDLLVVGNSDDPAVMVGVYDAMAALHLKGNKDGSFIPVPPLDNGLSLNGEIRKIIWLPGEKTNKVVFLRNNAGAISMEIK